MAGEQAGDTGKLLLAGAALCTTPAEGMSVSVSFRQEASRCAAACGTHHHVMWPCFCTAIQLFELACCVYMPTLLSPLVVLLVQGD